MNNKSYSVKKLALAGMLCAVAVVGSMFISFPMFGSRCAPVQHMVNILCAVLLGPWYGTAVAFVTSLLRIILNSGTLMAFPGSMCGALLCGITFWKSRNLIATLIAEVAGTSVVGGLAAYPVAVSFMNLTPASYTVYIVPFLISTGVGSLLAGMLVFALQRSGALRSMRAALEN